MALFQSFRVALPACCTNCVGLMSWSLNCKRRRRKKAVVSLQRGEYNRYSRGQYEDHHVWLGDEGLTMSTYFDTRDVDSRAHKLLK